MSFYYRDGTFSTLISFYYGDGTFSSLMSFYYRDGTFSTLISFYYGDGIFVFSVFKNMAARFPEISEHEIQQVTEKSVNKKY